MGHYLAEKFRQSRLARKLTPREVAIGIGYRNLNKGLRYVHGFEENGCGHTEFLNKIIDLFTWDRAEVQHLLDLEHKEAEQERQKWLDEPIEPFCYTKPIAGIYIQYKLPDDCKDHASAEQFILDLSKRLQHRAWYVMSRRVSVYFNNGVRVGEWVVNGELPRMYLGRKRIKPFMMEVHPQKTP